MKRARCFKGRHVSHQDHIRYRKRKSRAARSIRHDLENRLPPIKDLFDKGEDNVS